MLPTLLKAPVWPPWISTPVALSTSVNWMVPSMVRELLLLIVAAGAAAVVGWIVTPLPMMRSSGWPLFAVAVATGVLCELEIVVAARADAATRTSGATAAAANNDLRIKPTPPGAPQQEPV